LAAKLPAHARKTNPDFAIAHIQKETIMAAVVHEIAWQTLTEAKERAREGKPVLIDFSAAPV
jgi:hypothetical protein